MLLAVDSVPPSETLSLSPPVAIIRAMMAAWRIKGKVIGTVLCCVVYESCAQ